MYKILLCCTSGLTTSMLVKAIKKEACKQNIEVLVWTVAASAIELAWADADCILIAPQDAGELEKIRRIVKTSIPVATIGQVDFSKMDGRVVLDQAIKLVKE